MTTLTGVLSPYKQTQLLELDPLLKRCFSISGSVGALFLIAVFLTPRQDIEITTIDQVPERFAKLILEEAPPPVVVAPKPAVKKEPRQEGPKGDGGGGGGGGGGGSPAPGPDRVVPNPSRTGGRASTDAPPPRVSGGGSAGRARAQAEVAEQLADVTGSLNGMIADITTTLSAGAGSEDIPASRRPRRGAVRSGRSGAEVGSIPSGPVGGGGVSRAETGPLSGTVLDIGLITKVGGTGNGLGTGDGGPGSGTGTGGGHGSGHGTGYGSGTGPGSGSGSGGGHGSGHGTGTGSGSGPGTGGGADLRSDASLLAVVRKYAAGIRFCYDNELKREPTLRGKLIVAITVAASGEVTGANVVEDTLRSAELTSCALAQIRSWKFPRIAEGIVTFQAPFVFTPPES